VISKTIYLYLVLFRNNSLSLQVKIINAEDTFVLKNQIT